FPARRLELRKRFIEEPAMVIDRDLPPDRLLGNERGKAGGLIPQLLQGLVAGDLDLAPEALALSLDLAAGLGGHLVRQLLSLAAALIEHVANLLAGVLHLGLELSTHALGLLAGALGFLNGRTDVLLAPLKPLEHRLPGELAQNPEENEEDHQGPD